MVWPEGLAMYVHVPFCERKCTYCDFYSIESTAHIDAFVQSVLQEITLRSALLPEPPTKTSTVFFGGGTPTLLTPRQVRSILRALPGNAVSASEITMEANPGTISRESLIGYRQAGVNRLSIGIQSLNQQELDFLTRIHTPQQALDAVMLARQAGFENVNVDVMFALPGQTPSSLEHTLLTLLELEPNHVSAYALVYERGTPLYSAMQKGIIKPTPADEDAELYELVCTMLHDAGYMQYEVSNFAKPGYECRHNLAYWHGRDHFSVGPSAHGLLCNERYWNHRSLTSWSQLVANNQLPHANTERLSKETRLTEYVFLTLRADGLPLADLHETHGIDVRSALQSRLPMWLAAGYIVDTGTHLKLTPRGYAICDAITIDVLEALTLHESHR